MQKILEGFYPRFVLDSDPLLNSVLNVLIILLLGLLALWIFHIVVNHLERRLDNRSFLKRSKNIFTLIKKAGRSVIYILVGVGLLSFIKVDFMETVFLALMIILLASFTDSLVKEIIPYLEEKLASKTSTKIDDVIFDLLKRFSTVII